MAIDIRIIVPLLALAMLAGCQQTAPPAAATPPSSPTATSSIVPKTEGLVSSAPQEQPGFVAPPVPVTAIAPPQIQPATPPWTPVNAVESFNDRAYPALREWTASAGGFHTAAKFAGLVEGQVQLHKGAGGEVVVPLNKLSDKDQQYLKELIRVDPAANVTIGKVSRVMDNRTISVTEERGYQLVHLEGLEPLDAEQKRGSEAKEALSTKVQDKHVWVEWREKNQSDFLIGQVYLDGRNINLEMVAEGLARHNREPRVNPRLANAELIAQHKRLGLWSDDFAESPFGFGTPR